MVAFITCNSNLVPFLEDLCGSNPCRFGFSIFLSFYWNRSDDLGINSPALWPTELVSHRLKCKHVCSIFGLAVLSNLASSKVLSRLASIDWRCKYYFTSDSLVSLQYLWKLYLLEMYWGLTVGCRVSFYRYYWSICLCIDSSIDRRFTENLNLKIISPGSRTRDFTVLVEVFAD